MRDRPKEWLDRYLQFVGRKRNDADAPLPVAIWQDGRGISSREAAPYAMFANATSTNPGAGNHRCYTFTPTLASLRLVIRFSALAFARETATDVVDIGIRTATTKAASAAQVVIGDVTGLTVTADDVTNANLPALSLFNFVPATDPSSFPYPEYFLEAIVPANQVVEIMNRTQDGFLNIRCGFYTLPPV